MEEADEIADKHEQARDLAEEALGKLVEGKDAEANALIEKAKKIDRSGVQELLDDLEEDEADRRAAGESQAASR